MSGGTRCAQRRWPGARGTIPARAHDMSRSAAQIYFDEFRRHAARVPEQRFGRDEAFAEAAHRAYRTTADHLSRHEHWDDDRTLLVTHAFGQTVKEWIGRGGNDWEDLRDRLNARERALQRDRPGSEH